MTASLPGAARAYRRRSRQTHIIVDERAELKREIVRVAIAFAALAALFYWATTVVAP